MINLPPTVPPPAPPPPACLELHVQQRVGEWRVDDLVRQPDGKTGRIASFACSIGGHQPAALVMREHGFYSVVPLADLARP